MGEVEPAELLRREAERAMSEWRYSDAAGWAEAWGAAPGLDAHTVLEAQIMQASALRGAASQAGAGALFRALLAESDSLLARVEEQVAALEVPTCADLMIRAQALLERDPPRLHAALDATADALATSPTPEEVRTLRQWREWVLFDLGRPIEALGEIILSRGGTTSSAADWYTLGTDLVYEGRIDHAAIAAACGQAYGGEDAFSDPDYLWLEAAVLLAAGPPTARERLIDAVAAFPDDGRLLYLLAEAHFECRDRTEATRVANRALTKPGWTEVRMCCRFATLFEALGSVESALLVLEKGIQATPAPAQRLTLARSRADIRFRQANLFLVTGLRVLENAAEAIAEVIALAPADPHAHHQMAECLAHMGRGAEAESEVEVALALGLDTYETRFMLASLVQARGVRLHSVSGLEAARPVLEEAVSHFYRAAAHDPGQWTAAEEAAWTLVLMEEKGRARQLLRDILKRHPDAQESRDLLNALEGPGPDPGIR